MFWKKGPYINNRGSLVIEDGVRLNSSFESNPIGGSEKMIIIVRPNASLIIKRGAAISNTAIICWNKIEIQENVYIGGDCKIYDTDFHPIGFSDRLKNDKSLAKTAPILIKSGAFIGGGSMILKGVTIGAKSIVGAGSVVAKDIPDGEIWAGNPVRFIRKLTASELK